jgi:hypothetical protein
MNIPIVWTVGLSHHPTHCTLRSDCSKLYNIYSTKTKAMQMTRRYSLLIYMTLIEISLINEHVKTNTIHEKNNQFLINPLYILTEVVKL